MRQKHLSYHIQGVRFHFLDSLVVTLQSRLLVGNGFAMFWASWIPWFLGAFANSEKRLLAASCLSAYLSARNSAPTGRIFMIFDI